MATFNLTAIAATLVTYAKAGAVQEDAINSIVSDIKGQVTPSEIREHLLELVAATYCVGLRAKEKGAGVTWDETAENFEAAKTCLRRIIERKCGTGTAAKAKAAKSSDEAKPAAKANKAEAAAVAMFIQMVGSRKRALELLNAAK